MTIHYNVATPPVRSCPGRGSSSITSSKEDTLDALDLGRCTLKEFTEITEENHNLPKLQPISTPPDSPTRIRSAMVDTRKPQHNSAMTPPATPTSPSYFKSGSRSDDYNIQTCLVRHGSTASTASVPRSPSIHSHPVAVQLFDHELLEYVVLVDDNDKKRPIGTGIWSDVYLAAPSLPKPADQSFLLPPSATKSPPATPVKSNDSAVGLQSFPPVPPLYAIKAPASTSSRKVLREEAKVLSYLSQFPDSDEHIIQFFGLDTRNDALVLKAMDGTLEDWIKTHLNNLDEHSRAAKLASVFPQIALALIDSLIWMQDKNCVHADIKPANVLTCNNNNTTPTTTTSPAPKTVYSDFSSTILTTPELKVHNASPLGAGTWDYLDPSLLHTSASPTPPSPATDLWSLAITLLFLIIGTSPFNAFRHNKYQQREMIKCGSPLQCLAYDDVGVRNLRRLRELSGALGLDLYAWFEKVLVKDVGMRSGVEEWREEFVCAVLRGGGVV